MKQKQVRILYTGGTILCYLFVQRGTKSAWDKGFVESYQFKTSFNDLM